MPKTLYKLSKKFCKEKDIEINSTMIETKASFAERAIQSVKHIIYPYIEDHGGNNVPKLQQFVPTLNCRKNRSIGKSPRDVKNSDFYQYCITDRSRKILIQNSKLVIELEFRKMRFRFKKDTSPSLQTEFLKFRQYLQPNLLHTSSKIAEKKKIWENFMKSAEKMFRSKVNCFLN